jgi:signal recognition particle subunit SRP54
MFLSYSYGEILGMGDVVSLVERAQEQFDEEEEKKSKENC